MIAVLIIAGLVILGLVAVVIFLLRQRPQNQAMTTDQPTTQPANIESWWKKLSFHRGPKVVETAPIILTDAQRQVLEDKTVEHLNQPIFKKDQLVAMLRARKPDEVKSGDTKQTVAEKIAKAMSNEELVSWFGIPEQPATAATTASATAAATAAAMAVTPPQPVGATTATEAPPQPVTNTGVTPPVPPTPPAGIAQTRVYQSRRNPWNTALLAGILAAVIITTIGVWHKIENQTVENQTVQTQTTGTETVADQQVNTSTVQTQAVQQQNVEKQQVDNSHVDYQQVDTQHVDNSYVDNQYVARQSVGSSSGGTASDPSGSSGSSGSGSSSAGPSIAAQPSGEAAAASVNLGYRDGSIPTAGVSASQ